MLCIIVHGQESCSFTIFFVVWTVEGAMGSYFERRVSNGKAAIIINPEKDFAFLYKVKAGQLVITFHYGFWNKSGFPLHS